MNLVYLHTMGRHLDTFQQSTVVTGWCNGGTVAGLAMIGTVVAWTLGLKQDAAAGLVIFGAGFMEITGAVLVSKAKPEGFRWMKAAQILLFCSLATYVLVRAFTFSLENLTANPAGAMLTDFFAKQHMSAPFVRTLCILGAFVFVGLCAIFQTCLYIFYSKAQKRSEVP